MSYFFVRLPLELRDMVYQDLLTSAHTITVEPAKRGRVRGKPKHGLYPAILRTCKQAYAEGYNYLYKENYFHFECWDCDFFAFRFSMKRIDYFPVLGRACDFQNIKHLTVSYCGANCDRIWPRAPGTYLNDLKRGVESLTRLNCRLDTLHVICDLEDQAFSFEDYAWRNHKTDTVLGMAVDKRIKGAVARFKVKDEIRITITSGDTAGYRFTEAFVKLLGSMKGWAVTVDTQPISPEAERYDPRKSVWTIFLKPATADTKGLIPVIDHNGGIV